MLLISHNFFNSSQLLSQKSRMQYIKHYRRYVIMQKFWNKLVADYIALKLEPICFIIRLKGFFPPKIL